MAKTKARPLRQKTVSSAKKTSPQPAPVNGARRRGGGPLAVGAGLHTESENHPWTIAIPDHPARTDSETYIQSRLVMNKLAGTIQDFFGGKPWQDHHGGGLWLQDDKGWFVVRNVAGMEWSSQFCADPAKVDSLRNNASRLYARFPQAAQQLGIPELLQAKIQTADDIAKWTDSICNASIPLPPGFHTGILPQGGGIHHYPAPVAEIALFKFDSFKLWVMDSEAQPAAVTPTSPPGSGDGRVRVIYSTAGTQLRKAHLEALNQNQPLILPEDHPLARQAFRNQRGTPTTPHPLTDGLVPSGQHTESEDHPWTIEIPDHPGRTDSPDYKKARTAMNAMAKTINNFFYGPAPWQDHHGGGLWLWDKPTGWFLVRNLVGIEWSAQFCADPKKVDLLRQNAQRLYAQFPEAVKALDIAALLSTPIKDADGVAKWTDSICNASVPLPAGLHTGILPMGGGIHHYPAPISEIALFKFDSFRLWVLDPQGNPAAVTPTSRPGLGDSRVQVVYSTPNSQLHADHLQAEARGEQLTLPGDHPMAKQAYLYQNRPAHVHRVAPVLAPAGAGSR